MKVPDTPENPEICNRFCGPCPTFHENRLMDTGPHALFCARGPTKKTDSVSRNYDCPQCGAAGKYSLADGWFCLHTVKGE